MKSLMGAKSFNIRMLTPYALLFSFHPAVAYFIGIFRYQVQCYADRLTALTRPRKVAVCMIYNLDERNGERFGSEFGPKPCFFLVFS